MNIGKTPKTRNRIIPGNKKSSNGESFKIESGKPPSNFPDGEIIKVPPPPKALNPKNESKNI